MGFLKNIKNKILRLNNTFRDVLNDVAFKSEKTDKFCSLDEILDLVAVPDNFFAVVNSKKSLFAFVSNLSELYSKNFGLPKPNVKYNQRDFDGKTDMNGFALKNCLCINPKFFVECEKLVKCGSEAEKLNFIISVMRTTIHETTHVLQFHLQEILLSGKLLPQMTIDEKVVNPIVFSAYINSLISLLKDLYKSKNLRVSQLLCLDDAFNLFIGAETFEDKLELQNEKFYGNNPSEVSARLSAINFLKKMVEKQPKYGKLLQQEESENNLWIVDGKTDLYKAIFLPCQKYINNANWERVLGIDVDGRVLLLENIFQNFKDFCFNDKGFESICTLITLAEDEALGKYSKFAKDVNEISLKQGDTSQEEFDDFDKNLNVHEKNKQEAIKLTNEAFMDKE